MAPLSKVPNPWKNALENSRHQHERFETWVETCEDRYFGAAHSFKARLEVRNDAPRGINQQVFGASPARGRSKTIWKKLVARAYSKAQLTFLISHVKTNNNNLLDAIKCFLSFPSPLLATCKTTARQRKEKRPGPFSN